jgi:hypothetical protein
VVGRIDGLAEQAASVGSVTATMQERAEVGLGTGMLEAGVGPGEDRDCLAQQGLAALAAGD